jgi:hypothetical protein
MSEQKTPDEKLLPCPKCGEFGLQARDVKFDPASRRQFLGQFYVHCFDGDCGFEGPRGTEVQSRRAWNSIARKPK